MMASMSASGKAFLGWTKVGRAGPRPQVSQWEQFGLGRHLLGQESGSYWDFMGLENADNTGCTYSNLKDQSGAPTGPNQVSGSAPSPAPLPMGR